MIRRGVRFAAPFSAALLCCRVALADTAANERVAVVATASTPLVERFCAELRGLGFEVVAEATPGATSADLLEASAQRNHAVFALGVSETPAVLELIVVDATGALLMHESIARDTGRTDDDAVIALSAAELARASALGREEEE